MKLLLRILVPLFIGIASVLLFKDKESARLWAYTAIDRVKSLTSAITSTQHTPSSPAEPVAAAAIIISDSPMSAQRAIRQVVLAVEQAEGAGARVRRSIGTAALRSLSPFLMLDYFSIKPGSGFPDHPHRGQETITYLLRGGVDHEDFAGNRGTLDAGDLQFMTAGRGIVHAEMPRQNPDGSANVGLQLWVDLPRELKSCEPRYRDLRAAEIPSVDVDDGRATVKVISGQSHGVDSVKDLAYTPVWILDVTLRPGAKVTQPLPQGWTAFAFTLEGNTFFGKDDQRRKVEQFHNVVFEPTGDLVHVEADPEATEPSRLGKSIRHRTLKPPSLWNNLANVLEQS